MAKYSKTAEKLLPYLLQDLQVEPVIIAQAGGSGGISDHGGLTGLTDVGDHPGYLLTDGTRTLTGNMAVSSGVTIDGVDIGAHAANVNAHHAQVHALVSSDHTASGLTTGHVLRASGATTFAFAATQHSDLGGVTANQHHNQQHSITGSDHTITGSALQVVGATATNTLGLLTPSADVGTTPAEALLKSNGSGALTLGSLTSKGNVDVLNGGDLTVAGSGSYAGTNVLFVDSSGGNVGIMGAPDPQFALDIVGPARASYWIGPHAIQLKDVLFLSHYDGRFPIETNFSGEPNGHMGQVATLNGNVVYKAGKFGKAVQLARGTTNLITNPRPNPAGGTTGWNYFAGTAPTNATITTTLPAGFVGVRAMYYAGLQFGWPNTISVTNTGSYQYSGWILASANCTMSFYIQQEGGAYGTISNAPTLALTANVWTQFDVTLTATATATGRFVFTTSGAPNVTIANVQVETGAGATPYHDGDMLTPASWTGTAHASTSTRAASHITYPTAGNINANAWTCMAWVYLHSVGDTQTVWRINGSTSGYIWLRISSAALAEGLHGSAPTVLSSSTLAKKTWYHLVVTYDGTTLKMYVNGTEEDSDTGGTFSGMPSSMAVGGAPGGAEYLNGLIDDLVILSRAMPAGEVLSVYESDAPVFAETARFSFRATPQGLVWADDEGLWMRDATGGPVLGAYGGEAASKSWASLTLAPGDVVIGDGASAYMLWDDSAATLTLGKTGASNAYLYLTGTGITLRSNSVDRVSLTGAGVLTLNDTAGTAQVTLSGSGTALFGETGVSKTNVYIASGTMQFRVNTTARLSLTSGGDMTFWDALSTARIALTNSGELTIKNSVGNAIFTFDASSGAEFTRPLTLGTSGGIYQGTGTFASPTTGLKMWNDSGVGRIAGYNSGDLQWFNSTSGYLYAGRNAPNSTAHGSDRWALRMARDGLRILGEANTSFDQKTSTAAIRWVFNSTYDIDATIDLTTSYASLYSYNNTTSNIVYAGLTSFVGSGVYTTKDATVYLTAQHYTGSVYHGVDFTLTTVKSTGATYAYCNADEFQLTKALKFDEMTAPSAPGANGVLIYAVDNGSGKTKLMALFASGAAQQIAIQP